MCVPAYLCSCTVHKCVTMSSEGESVPPSTLSPVPPRHVLTRPSGHSLTCPSWALLTCSGDTFHAPFGSAEPRPRVSFGEQIISHQFSKCCVYIFFFFFSRVPLKIKDLRLSPDVTRDDGCGSSRPSSWGLGQGWAATGSRQCWVKLTFDLGSPLWRFCPASPLHSRADRCEPLTPRATWPSQFCDRRASSEMHLALVGPQGSRQWFRASFSRIQLFTATAISLHCRESTNACAAM